MLFASDTLLVVTVDLSLVRAAPGLVLVPGRPSHGARPWPGKGLHRACDCEPRPESLAAHRGQVTVTVLHLNFKSDSCSSLSCYDSSESGGHPEHPPQTEIKLRLTGGVIRSHTPTPGDRDRRTPGCRRRMGQPEIQPPPVTVSDQAGRNLT